jgi:hypothetical protein
VVQNESFSISASELMIALLQLKLGLPPSGKHASESRRRHCRGCHEMNRAEPDVAQTVWMVTL